MLKRGSEVVLTTRQVAGSEKLVPMNFPTLPQGVKAGDTVFIDDGAMQLKVQDVGETELKCKVIVGGLLTAGRGIVIPGLLTSAPYITSGLQRHIDFVIEQKADYIALSFVSGPDDVQQTRAALNQKGCNIPIIAKIERGLAVDNIDKLVAISEGIMVARGDLGIEIPLQRVPLVQKKIIKKCNRAGKPVITATQMLESMVNSARPTRAEVTDVANAIFDGTDAVMLSAETSIGKYPVLAVKMMTQIGRETQNQLPYESMLAERSTWLGSETEEIISYDACHAAHQLGAVAIIAFTQSGSTAWRVSKYRPKTPIIAITPSRDVCSRLVLGWGIQPFQIAEPSSVSELFTTGARLSKELGLARAGDLVVITGGIPVGVSGTTNLLKVERVE
jgi:pyruvate kinase